MKKYAFLAMTLLALNGCRKLEIDQDAPKCIEQKIKEFNKLGANEGAKVDEFTFQGKTVFGFDDGPNVADGQMAILDEDCNPLGAVGGMSANYVVNGETWAHAVFVKNIWEK